MMRDSGLFCQREGGFYEKREKDADSFPGRGGFTQTQLLLKARREDLTPIQFFRYSSEDREGEEKKKKRKGGRVFTETKGGDCPHTCLTREESKKEEVHFRGREGAAALFH